MSGACSSAAVRSSSARLGCPAARNAIAINALDVAQELAAAAAAAQPSSGEWSRDLARIADRRGDRHQALTARARVANLGDATDEDFAALADTAEQLHDPQAALQAWSRIAPERRDANPAWSRGAISALVDTTGAGDLFAAGFLFGLARGFTHADCAVLGTIAASEVIGHIGPRPAASLADLARDAGFPI